MPYRDIVVIGGSAGGLEALTVIVRQLPASLRACVLVALHTSASANGLLPGILERVSNLPVAFARTGDPPSPGRIYVAPPDRHLIVTAGGLRVVHGPRENGFRPAIDPLFRTAARTFGTRLLGVILSGALSDGTFGLSLIKHHGGIALVQDPREAIIGSMPRHAMNAVDVDAVLPAAELAAEIVRLSADAASQGVETMAGTRELEPQLLSEDTQVAEMEDTYGAPSPLTCPDCGGVLWEVQEGRVVRYQCHVGHQYAPDVLDSEQRDSVDSALWSAVRILEEHAALKLRMARRAEAGGLTNVAAGFMEGARDAHAQAGHIRALLFAGGEPERRSEAADDRRSRRAAPKARARGSKGRKRTR